MVSDYANALDEAVRAQDRLILSGMAEGVSPRFLWRALQVRNDLMRPLAQEWQIGGVA